MRSFLLSVAGVVMAGVALFTGIGPDAEQVIRKNPRAVYAAFDEGLTQAVDRANMEQSDSDGAARFKLRLEREENEQLIVTMTVNDREAGEARLRFSPLKDATETRVTGDIEVNHSVVRDAFANTPNADVAKIPDVAWRLGMNELLKDAANRIEAGMPLADRDFRLPRSEVQEASEQSADEERWAARQRQEEATRPAVDPDEAARRYMAGGQK